jgi:PAS domain S-box-containing protein
LGVSKDTRSSNDSNLSTKQGIELFFDHSLDIMVLIGFDNKIKLVNPSFEKILGWKKEEVILKLFQDFLHPDDIEKSLKEAKAHESGTNAVRFENRYRCKNGSYRWISWNSHPLTEKKVVVGIGRDITERKKAEDELNIIEARLQRIAQAGHIGLFEYNATKDTAYWSPQHYELLGYPIGSKVTYKRWLQGVHPEDREHVANNFAKLNKEVCAVSELEGKDNYRYNRSDGSTIWIESSLSLKIVNGETLIQGYIQDVTERKKAELLIQSSDKQKNDILESITDGFVAFDKEWRYTYVNSNAARILCTPKEELIGKVAIEVFPNASKFLTQFKIAVSSGRPVHFEEYYPEPLNLWYECHCYPSESGLTVFFSDITERKKAEETLRRREAEFKTLAENAPDAIMRFDSNLRVLYLNPQDLAATGKRFDEFVGKTNEEMGMPAELCKLWNETFDRAKTSGKFQEVEFDFNTPAGIKTYNLRVVPEFTKDASLVSYLGISRDITDRKNTEEALRQSERKLEEYNKNLEKLVEERTKQLKDSERLAAIGATAGMVGHDIRNPLQAMVSDVYLIKDDLASMPTCENCSRAQNCVGGSTKQDIFESLDSIEENISYVNKIVQDLQDYARPLRPEYSEVDLSKVLVKVFEIVKLPDSIKLSINIKDLEKFKTDPLLLQRALSNLITNAIQAMPKGGILEVVSQPMDNKTVITVSDTGVGIPEEIKPKLFTPMMTTKSKGQGFGLAVSKRLIEAMKGTLSFESEEGKGTKFIIELPLPS